MSLKNTKAARLAGRWTPASGASESVPNVDAIVWRYMDKGFFNFCIYQGSKAKAVLHLTCPSSERREGLIKKWIAGEEQKIAERDRRKVEADRTAAEFFQQLQMGSIFFTLSGYEQTNAYFFEVVGAVTVNSAVVRPIKQQQIESKPLSMCGHAIPKKGEFTGKEVKWKIKDKYPAIWTPDRKVSISWYG